MADQSKRVINFSIGFLTVSVVIFTAMLSWHAYEDLRSARQAESVNILTDKIYTGSSRLALERGLTMAALGSPRPAKPETLQKIGDARKDCNVLWKAALDMSHLVTGTLPTRPDFRKAIEHADHSHEAVHHARERVDNSLQQGGPGISAFEWFDIATRFINDGRHVREIANAAVNYPNDIFLNSMTIKYYGWYVSEYSGRERAILAYYIASRLRIPPDRLDELKSFRGVVDHAEHKLEELMQNEATTPAIRDKVALMIQDYDTRYEQVRHAIFAAADTGNYPLSADVWIASATLAINHALDVVDAASAEIGHDARTLVSNRTRQLVFYLALTILTLGLSLYGLRRVRQTTDALFHEKELAEVTLHSIGDAVITTDDRGFVDYMNPIAETLTGWSIKEARGQPLSEVFHIVNGVTREPQDNPANRCLQEQRIVGLENNTVLIARDGTERVIEDSAAPVRNREQKIVGAVLVFYDVTLMRNSPHLLSHHATHDALTGLINRREFDRRLTALVESSKNNGKHHVLLYMDLDQFKIVNDTCGHIAGDKLLRQLSFLLKNRIRGTDTIARLGGDEFGVLLENCQIEPALRLANALVKLVNDFRFVWEGTSFEVGASIGLVPITPESESPVKLLSQADACCYTAKDKGRNRIYVYQPDDAQMQQRHGEMQWVSRIRKAIKEDRFVLYCHKILPLSSQPNGDRYCETLLRMVDEQGEVIPPMAFIPAAERYDLMPAIDRWVIKNSMAIFGNYRREVENYTPQCFINLGAASLSDETMFDYIREQLEANQMPPNEICFEITETAAVANLDLAVTFMRKIKSLGCRFALDDFGSGMSSFGYLKNLPVDYLKIDGSFIQNMVASPTDCAMVDAINRVGHVMGIQTIAEFVKDEATLEKLRELGVDFAQGYGIAMPEPMTTHLPGGPAGCCSVCVPTDQPKP